MDVLVNSHGNLCLPSISNVAGILVSPAPSEVYKWFAVLSDYKINELLVFLSPVTQTFSRCITVQHLLVKFLSFDYRTKLIGLATCSLD